MSRRRRSISKRGPLALAACGLIFGAARLFSAEEDAGKMLDAIQQQVRAIYDSSGAAVVRIEATAGRDRVAGTGFFIDPNGTLYTSYGVGGESQDIVVHFRGARHPATRLISDLRSGIALLKIEAETPFLTFAKARELALAAPVIALGYPRELPLTPSFGIVGGFDLKLGDRYFATTHIRASLPVQRGEGGAPLLNLKGEVVGIIVSTLEGGGASFALPIEAAEKVRMDFTRFREAHPGWIGVHVKTAGIAIAGSTAEIEEVLPDAPAQKAGLRPGDVLLQIGTRKIAAAEDILDASFFLTADDDVPVRIARAGQELEIKLQPGDPPNALRTLLPKIGSLDEGPKAGR